MPRKRVPYSRDLAEWNPCSESDTSLAVVGNLSYVAVRPGAGVILAVKQIIVPSDATVKSLSVRVCAAADLAAAPPAVQSVSLLDLDDISQVKTSSLWLGSKNAFIANGLFGLTVPANGPPTVFEFPGLGLLMWGNEPAGLPGLAVQENVPNRDLHLGYMCYEWPIIIK